MNRTLRVTCLLLVSMLSQVIGCGLEGLLGVEQPAEETWNPVYTPVSSVGLLLQGAPNGPSNAALKATSGTVVIDTDAVTITVGGTVHPGTIRTQADGPEVAEFTFDSIHLGSDVTVTTQGARVLSLVARGDVVIETTLDVSGEDGALNKGGSARLGGGRGGQPRAEARGSLFYEVYGEEGQGKGGGKMSFYAPGGGGFGGAGAWEEVRSPFRTDQIGGQPYGNLALTLEGGSGGATGWMWAALRKTPTCMAGAAAEDASRSPRAGSFGSPGPFWPMGAMGPTRTIAIFRPALAGAAAGSCFQLSG